MKTKQRRHAGVLISFLMLCIAPRYNETFICRPAILSIHNLRHLSTLFLLIPSSIYPKGFKKEVTFQRPNFRNMKVSLEKTPISLPSHRDPA